MVPTSFSDMPTLASSTSPNPQPFHRRRRSWARKIERCCYNTFAYFPLVFVYGLTTWAVWVEITVSLLGTSSWFKYSQAALGGALYALANTSYTTAVFSSPGSPLDPKQDLSRKRRTGGYEGLPTHEHGAEARDEAVPREWMTTVTAKSTGKPRYCKKCRVVKPDRTHHCSTCGRCVLKMDHHCPWLATCVGLRNYKPFLLFLIYTCLFCYVCFAVSAYWVWVELTNQTQMTEGMRVVNTLLLAVLSGIIGLVLSGFLGWHLYLTATGQTTIESLEKTRYLSPLRKSLQVQPHAGRHFLGQGSLHSGVSVLDDDQPLADRIKQIHANALPGILRPEEGDSSLDPSRNPTPTPMPGAVTSGSPAHDSLQRSYASMEAQRERDRYNLYLDEQDSTKMPNAFDMGWRRNLSHVFGPQPLLWFVPVCNTTGDGWAWDVSPKWTEARDRIGRERAQYEQRNAQWGRQRTFEPPPQRRAADWQRNAGSGFADHAQLPPHVSQAHEGRSMNGSANVQMHTLDRRKASTGHEEAADLYDANVEESLRRDGRAQRRDDTVNWNDIPDDFLAPSNEENQRSRSEGRRKGD